MIAAMIGFAANRLGIGGALATLVVWGVIVLAASGAALGAYHYVKHLGYVEKSNEVKKQNDRAGEAGNGARMSYDDCLNRNGVYHFDTGRCVGP